MIIYSSLNGRELLKSFALNGKNCFNVRVFNRDSFAKELLLRSGIIISEEIVSNTRQECIIHSIAKEVSYFKDNSFEDSVHLNRSINDARLLCRNNEEEKIVEVFSDGEFVRKNKAILEVYQKYKQYLDNHQLIDSIEIINRAIKLALPIDEEIVVLNEIVLEPLEEELLKKGNSVSYSSIISFLGKEENKLQRITYADAYGEVNEIEYILGYIAKNKIPFEDVCISTISNRYQTHLLSFRDTYNLPLSFSEGYSLSDTNAFKLLTLIDKWNRGYNSINVFEDMIYSPCFNTEKFFETVGLNKLKPKDVNKILEAIGNLRLTTTKDNKLEDYYKVASNKIYPFVEKIANELYGGYSYLIKEYTRISSETFDEKGIAQICSYIDEYFNNVTNASISDVVLSLSNKKMNPEFSRNGCIHVTSLKGALASFRKHLFICGLNAKDFPGSPSEDYLLLDSDLDRFNEINIKNSQNKVLQNKQLLLSVIKNASAMGSNIHLSYSGYNLSELKSENPSSSLFEIFKLENGDDSKVEDFNSAIGIQHSYFSEDVSSLKNVANKYLEGINVNGDNEAEEKYSSTLTNLVISPSAADIFFTCPKHFYLTSILGIKEPDIDDPFVVLPAKDEGTLIHECMQDLGNNPNWSIEEFMENAEKKFDNYLLKRKPIHNKKIASIKSNFLDMARYGYQSDKHNKINASEKYVGPYIDKNTGLSFGGIIDRIEELDNGKLVIVDYKTYKDIKNIKDDIDTCFQVVLYAYVLEKTSGKIVEKCEYRYLRNPRTIECAYDDNIKEQLSNKLAQIKQALDSGVFECADDEDACKYCKLGHICGKDKEVKDGQ